MSAADAVDLPFLPAYLAGLKPEDYKKGANFAVIGATVLDHFQVDPSSSAPSASIFGAAAAAAMSPDVATSLRVQMEWFKTLLPSLCSNNITSTRDDDCQQLLRNSLFHIGEIGAYDYSLDKNNTELEGLVPRVVDTIILTLNELISSGAVELMVAGLFPIGCLPRAQKNYFMTHEFDQNGCVFELNRIARQHNTQLQISLQQLGTQHPHVNIFYADYYNAAMRLISSRLEYGFTHNKDLLSTTCCEAKGLDLFLYEDRSESCESLINTSLQLATSLPQLSICCQGSVFCNSILVKLCSFEVDYSPSAIEVMFLNICILFYH